jgi:anti-sigma factor ChrR (cupin superfamily)
MDKNEDFSKRVVIHTEKMDWLASPVVGVSRRPLDRVGGEVARATSIVRYAPGSQFSPHSHAGGEELFILEGVFQDEHGNFPAGSYIRNPPGSRHTPGSAAGCVIFVKLWQFDLADRMQVHLDSTKLLAVEDVSRTGVSAIPLFQNKRETVCLEYWAANAEIELDAMGGMELLVIDGDFTEGNDHLQRHDWLRLPLGATGKAIIGSRGATVWTKTGHLRTVEQEVAIVRTRQ